MSLEIDNNGRALNNGEDIGTIEDAVSKGMVKPMDAVAAFQARHAALKATVDDLTAQKTSAESSRQAILAASKAALAAPDDEKAKEAIAAAIAEAETPELDKKRAEIQQQISTLQDELATLGK